MGEGFSDVRGEGKGRGELCRFFQLVAVDPITEIVNRHPATHSRLIDHDIENGRGIDKKN